MYRAQCLATLALTGVLVLVGCACTGPAIPTPVEAPCAAKKPPSPSEFEGWRDVEQPGETLVFEVGDLDGDGVQDLFVTGSELRAAQGSWAGVIMLDRGQCGVNVGLVWGREVRHRAARHNGLQDLVVSSVEQMAQVETRYCFDGRRYRPFAERRRGYYAPPQGTQPGRLRPVLLDEHWEQWSVVDACDPS